MEPNKTKRVNFFFLFFFTLILFIIFHFIFQSIKNRNSSGRSILSANQENHDIYSFDSVRFFKSINKAKIKNIKNSINIFGGIVSHHEAAIDLIADFFNHISSKKPDTIVLIGPNHSEKGDSNILTGKQPWNTVFGILYPDKQKIDYLINNKIVSVDEKILENDQSVYTLVPFIKYFFKDSLILPLLVKRGLTIIESEKLAEIISSYKKENVLIIASVDFSHYLKKEEAEKNDFVTKEIIEKRDYKRLYSLNSDYLDSPPSVGILLMTMEKEGISNMELIQNTNSGEILKDPKLPTTSYFTYLFY